LAGSWRGKGRSGGGEKQEQRAARVQGLWWGKEQSSHAVLILLYGGRGKLQGRLSWKEKKVRLGWVDILDRISSISFANRIR
jgi:hypothetical protein